MRRGKMELFRRGFLRPMVAFAVAVTSADVKAGVAQASPPLTIAVVAGESAASRSTVRGIDFGIGEARHAAKLFQKSLDRVNVRDCLDTGAAQVLIYAGEADDTGRIAGQCAGRGIVFLNAVSSADSLRARCSPLGFHIAASDSMRRSASRTANGAGRVEMWEKTLERFGAGQLNDRYRHYGGEMGSAEWAGWMAVKIAWEAYLRAPEGTPGAIAAWLSGNAAHFDGHKGAPLSFRSWDHQLRQPLYVIADSGRISEVPSLSGSDVPVRELLDALGGPQGDRRCG